MVSAVRGRPGRRRRPSGGRDRRTRRRARHRVRGRTARARLCLAARARRLRPVRLRTRQHVAPSVHVAVPAPLSRRPRPAVGHRARRAARAAGARGPAGRLPYARSQFAGGPSQVRPPWHMARGQWPMLRIPITASRLIAVADAALAGDVASTMPAAAVRTVTAGVADPGLASARPARATAHPLTIALAEPARRSGAARGGAAVGRGGGNRGGGGRRASRRRRGRGGAMAAPGPTARLGVAGDGRGRSR